MVIVFQDRHTTDILEAVRAWCRARTALERARTNYFRHNHDRLFLPEVHDALLRLDETVDRLAQLACRP